MSVRESFLVTIPSEYREFSSIVRVDPNSGHFPLDAEAHVRTESGHDMVFQPRQIGQSALYLLALVSSEPPITDSKIGDKEVWVRGDVIAVGKAFSLDSAFPIFKDGQTDFRAESITANIDLIDIQIED